MLTGNALPPIGMKKEEREETATQQKARRMLQTVQTTEELVEKVLEMLELQGESDEDWPDDTVPAWAIYGSGLVLAGPRFSRECSHESGACADLVY